MLSILIPTYNYNARALVDSLLSLARAEEQEVEIIVGDDGSTTETGWLDELPTSASLKVFRAAENLGRSRIRNRLAEEAAGQWLLFIDCDALVTPDFSLRRYMEATAEADVICGGIRHPETLPHPGCELRWRYEREAERRFTPRRLNAQQHVPFRTFSFLIRKDLFQEVRFDEHIRNYGYEDVLFGKQLEQHGARILYIDCPLLNGDIEPNEVFLAKTEEALRTLVGLQGSIADYIALERTAQRLKGYHLTRPLLACYRLTRPLLRRNLLSQHPLLSLFAFYKLGYYLNIK